MAAEHEGIGSKRRHILSVVALVIGRRMGMMRNQHE
jgi:hypothetical protein